METNPKSHRKTAYRDPVIMGSQAALNEYTSSIVPASMAQETSPMRKK